MLLQEYVPSYVQTVTGATAEMATDNTYPLTAQAARTGQSTLGADDCRHGGGWRSSTVAAAPSTPRLPVAQKDQYFHRPSSDGVRLPGKGIKAVSRDKIARTTDREEEEDEDEEEEDEDEEEQDSSRGTPKRPRSERSPSDSSPERVREVEEKNNKKKKKTERSRSRSRSPARSESRGHIEKERSHRPTSRSRDKTARSDGESSKKRPRQRSASRQPPTTVEAVNNELYETIQKTKSRQIEEAEKEHRTDCRRPRATCSRASSVVPSVCSSKKNDKYKLPKDLEENALYKKTIRVMEHRLNLPKKTFQENAAGIKLIGSKKSMTDPRWVDTEKYLFSITSRGTGCDYQTLLENRCLNKASLYDALDIGRIKDDPNCLDRVFREALKQISNEIHNLEDDPLYTSTQKPHFVSARYLELKLLQKIQNHYQRTIQQDFLKYLTAALHDDQSPFSSLCDGNKCERYLRKLTDFYGVKPIHVLYEVMKEPLATPTAMRVWTDVENQRKINNALAEFATSVYRKVKSRWVGMSETEKTANPLPPYFHREYWKALEPLVGDRSFLTEVVNRSELFAWLCLGMTSDNIEHGSLAMAASYIQIELEERTKKTRHYIAWNFPLASMTSRESTAAAAQEPFSSKDESFWVENMDLFTE